MRIFWTWSSTASSEAKGAPRLKQLGDEEGRTGERGGRAAGRGRCRGGGGRSVLLKERGSHSRDWRGRRRTPRRARTPCVPLGSCRTRALPPPGASQSPSGPDPTAAAAPPAASAANAPLPLRAPAPLCPATALAPLPHSLHLPVSAHTLSTKGFPASNRSLNFI